MRNAVRMYLVLLAAFGVGAAIPSVQAADGPGSSFVETGQPPARLSFADGRVSFWRPGAPDWTQAAVNTPLAAGDELATGSPGSLELQVGARAFIRAGADTHLALSSQEPDFLQVKLTAGTAFLDLRGLDPGETVEVDTPNAAITLDHVGYYRVEIAGERTAIITRRGGRAAVTPASGGSVDLMPSEEAVVEGTLTPQLASYAAPPVDDWDRWNYARTDALLHAASARYVSPGTYGMDELDQYGTWRTVPDYGSVWVPTSVPTDWVPYSTGSWITDPLYGWTWVSSMPWGWAPFHYGRWVHVGGYWAWAPGPLMTRPVYAPALVAFLGTPSVGVGVSVGGPLVGWVALGWGEPCLPWWGPAGFAHQPWWGGWAGPRVVNNVVVSQTAMINESQITVYRNAAVQNAVVAVNHDHFGRGPIADFRVHQVDARSLHPLPAGVPVQATAASLAPSRTRGARPSDEVLRRPVVATRAPQARPTLPVAGTAPLGAPGSAPVHIAPVTRPTGGQPRVLIRPPFGGSSEERGLHDRQGQSAQLPPASGGSVTPRASRENRAALTPQGPPTPARTAQAPVPNAVTPAPRPAPPVPAAVSPREARRPGGAPAAPAPSPATRVAPTREQAPRISQAAPIRPAPLPGEPANRLAPHRTQAPQAAAPAPRAPQPPSHPAEHRGKTG